MQAYHLVTLEKVWGIHSLDQQHLDWYRYIISNGLSPITGYRSGNYSDVSAYVQANIKRLNHKYDIKDKKQLLHKAFIKPCYISDSQSYS